MTIRSKQDVAGLQRIGRIVANALQEMKAAMVEGMTTEELDAIGRKALEKHGARPAPELYFGFPGATCISVNEEAAHAIPGRRPIRNGDLVNLDVSAELDGYVADTGASIPFGDTPPMLRALCEATQEALQEALKVTRAGSRMADVQQAIDRVARRHGFVVIQNLAGHGIGRHLHEAPDHVPDYPRSKDRRRFQPGMVLTLEPFLSTGPRFARQSQNGWTLVTEPGHFTAQYEHTLIVTQSHPIVITA